MNDRDECMQTAKMQCAGPISSWTVVRNPFASMKSLVSGPETVKGRWVTQCIPCVAGNQVIRDQCPLSGKLYQLLADTRLFSTFQQATLPITLTFSLCLLYQTAIVYNSLSTTSPLIQINQYRGQKVLVVGLGMRPSPAPVSHTTLAAPPTIWRSSLARLGPSPLLVFYSGSPEVETQIKRGGQKQQ